MRKYLKIIIVFVCLCFTFLVKPLEIFACNNEIPLYNHSQFITSQKPQIYVLGENESYNIVVVNNKIEILCTNKNQPPYYVNEKIYFENNFISSLYKSLEYSLYDFNIYKNKKNSLKNVIVARAP